MIRQRQVYMGQVCCLACFKLDQDEAFLKGVMLSLGSSVRCSHCNSAECEMTDNHILRCKND